MHRHSCFLEVGSWKIAIDPLDMARVIKHSWRIRVGINGDVKVVTSIRKGRSVKSVGLARFLLQPADGEMAVLKTNSVHRFILDYRRSNLITVTSSQRQHRIYKPRENKTSIFRGVSLQAQSMRWRAAIQVNGVSLNLGDFDSEYEAARAYNVAAKKFFGDHATLNLIDSEAS